MRQSADNSVGSRHWGRNRSSHAIELYFFQIIGVRRLASFLLQLGLSKSLFGEKQLRVEIGRANIKRTLGATAQLLFEKKIVNGDGVIVPIVL